MSCEARPVARPQDLEIFQAYWAAQPRAVRVFSPDLDVLFDNQPRRSEAYPLFHGPRGDVIPFPLEERARQMWPVQQVRLGFPRSERNYTATPEGAAGPRCFRVRAYPLTLRPGGERLIVEEVEMQPPGGQKDCVDHLDHEVESLLRDVVEYLENGPNGNLPRMRLTNPNLQPCHEVKACSRRRCPAHDHPTNLRCWEIPLTTCPDVENDDPLTKFHYCNECEVFLMACPDPLTRVAENLNRLISLLQIKFQEALEAQRQLQQADKLAVLGELLAGIAHEIKNPLGIIMGRVDCLNLEMEGLSPDELADDLTVIREQAGRVQVLIDHLLEMASPGTPETEVLNPNDVIQDTLPMVRKVLKDAGVKVALKLGDNLPAIEGDPVQIQQVLINLILNARDAMPEGGNLTVASRAVVDEDSEAREVQVSVLDTGCGMTRAEMSRIFSAFYTTKREKGGTGLGLAVCHRIMRRHHGRITVESAPNKGTIMRLWFPAK